MTRSQMWNLVGWLPALAVALTACGDDGSIPGLDNFSVDVLHTKGNGPGVDTTPTSDTTTSSTGTTAVDVCFGLPDGTACGRYKVCRAQECGDSLCGDQVKGPNEECDDGNFNAGDGCSPFCLLERCGDGFQGSDEECDDGDRFDNDGCSSLCKREYCGDSTLQKSEGCDDGNRVGNDGCSAECLPESCGDGIVQASEGCDDGNLDGGDGCSKLCRIERECGNAIVEPGEDCDDGNTWDDDECPASCVWAVECGNGVVQVGEECDDGNLASNDGCTANCRSEGSCRAVVSEERLPVRDSVMNRVGNSVNTVKSTDLYSKFYQTCGPNCHSPSPGQPGSGTSKFKFSQFTLAADIAGKEQLVINAITKDDGSIQPMPPGRKPFHTLATTDQLYLLASQLQAWVDQAKPGTEFEWEDPNEGTENAGGFTVNASFSRELTNIGSCIPDRAAYQLEAKAGSAAATPSRSLEKDAWFAATETLPDRLSETDLFTLDSETLAHHGVLSYAPTYTLWADNAQKMRYVKIPFGQSVVFDPTTQQFTLPEHTRFYKTFLKQVKDLKGNTAYRKIETRIIVARKDFEVEGQPAQVRALFGTYRWNDDESEAFLVKEALRNGQPFIDQLFIFDQDEAGAEALRDELNNVDDPEQQAELAQRLSNERLIRHYLIPGAERCRQCHLGAVTKDFILGFSPVQLLRRPEGVGGVIEAAHEDDLTQLQRFIKLGVFAGLDSANQVTLLENLQGETKPRNDYELKAQGYMMGNCAHCHNPRGYPSVRAPQLVLALNFHPGTQDGGIFGFPLGGDELSDSRNQSPRMVWSNPAIAGAIPYITPSLSNPEGSLASGLFTNNPVPWRSLIYRNVDTPASYPDAGVGTVFPHMPMNTSGLDCRARNIMGDWMVSIPAELKDGVSADDVNSIERQPFREIKPGEEGYEAALLAAQERLAVYHTSDRYNLAKCENVRDIVDPEVAAGIRPSPIDDGSVMPRGAHVSVLDLTDPLDHWDPRRSDWKKFLTTENHGCEGTCNPDDPATAKSFALFEVLDEMKINSPALQELANENFPMGAWKAKPECQSKLLRFPTFGELRAKSSALPWLSWSQERVGDDKRVYQQKPGAVIFQEVCQHCHGANADSDGLLAASLADLTGQKARTANFKAGIFGPVNHPGLFADAVFQTEAAKLGVTTHDLSARYMAWMTLGGTTVSIPGAVMNMVFAESYLGQRRQPVPGTGDANMLTLGKLVCSGLLGVGPTDNENLYFEFLENSSRTTIRGRPIRDFSSTVGKKINPQINDFLLINDTGDPDMWERICITDNALPIRVLFPDDSDAGAAIANWRKVVGPVPQTISFGQPAAVEWRSGVLGHPVSALPLAINGSHVPHLRRFDRHDPSKSVYPADAYVLNQHGQVQKGIQADNISPMCIHPPHPDFKVQADEWLRSNGFPTGELPYCPISLFSEANAHNRLTALELEKWALRGAANAAFLVNMYLRELTGGMVQRPIPFDQCELLP